MFSLLGRCGGPASLSFLWQLTNGVAQHRGLALLVGRDRLESDRSAANALEEANALTDKDRSDMHDDLVQKPGLEALPGDVGAQDDDVRAIGSRLGKRHRLLNAHI